MINGLNDFSKFKSVEEINAFLIEENAKLHTEIEFLKDDVARLTKENSQSKGLVILYRESLIKVNMLLKRLGIELSRTLGSEQVFDMIIEKAKGEK